MPGELCTVSWLLAGAWLAACSPRVDYDDTHYRCDRSGTCPDGYSCEQGICLEGPGSGDKPDASIFDRPDAGEGGIRMMRAASGSELVIPDDDESGVADEVGFGSSCTIIDINVDVDISHEWPEELAVWLTSAEQTDVLLHEVGAPGTGDGIVGIYPTTLTPEDSLDVLLGEDGGGQWQLWVADVSSGDIGVLHAWAVTLWCD